MSSIRKSGWRTRSSTISKNTDSTAGESLQSLIEWAIEKEIAAFTLYSGCARRTQLRAQQVLFTELARAEQEHERHLRKLLEEGTADYVGAAPVEDLHLSDYMVDIDLTPESSPQDVMIFAMKNEEKAAAFYDTLARVQEHAETRALFEALSRDEKKHKHDLELQYNDTLQWEN